MAKDPKELKSRVTVQGELDEVSSALLQALALCKGQSNTRAALDLLENLLGSPEFRDQLKTAIDWSSEDNKEAAIQGLRSLGISPPDFD